MGLIIKNSMFLLIIEPKTVNPIAISLDLHIDFENKLGNEIVYILKLNKNQNYIIITQIQSWK